MKVKEALQQLAKMNPELELMFQDPNAHGGPFGVGTVTAKVSQGEFPDDFNMPEGYEFVLLQA